MIDGWFIVIIFNPLMHKSFSELANWLWACYFFQCENIEILIVCPRKCICILFCQTWFSSNVLSHTSQVIGSDASKCSRVMLKIRRKVLAELHELEVSKTRRGPQSLTRGRGKLGIWKAMSEPMLQVNGKIDACRVNNKFQSLHFHPFRETICFLLSFFSPERKFIAHK